MALEHAILVSLRERAASGAALTRRFDASIGYFWTATHQQIYRVLAKMQEAGWVEAVVVPQVDRPATKEYAVTPAGRDELRRWLAEPTAADPVRSDVGVKLRGASWGDRAAVLDDVRRLRADHAARHRLYRHLADRDFPDPQALAGADLDQYLVLRGGLLVEEFWISWLTEYLDAHETTKESD